MKVDTFTVKSVKMFGFVNKNTCCFKKKENYNKKCPNLVKDVNLKLQKVH